MNILIISCSLNPDSRSHRLAAHTEGILADQYHADVAFIDLRDYDLPFCDGATAYAHKDVHEIKAQIENADAILLAVPIYNYDVNAAAKNLIELTGRVWSDKVVGFLAAAGGQGSYMALMSLANSLMLDFHCLITPRFVYTTDQGFREAGHPKPNIDQRIRELLRDLTRLAEAWNPGRRQSRPSNSSSPLI